jgi:monoterpene epsilon-lactone hydrolase
MSWQLRILRLVTRICFKPVLRYGKLDFLRSYIAFIDRLVARKFSQPSVAERYASRTTDYGEWLSMVGIEPWKTILYLPGGAFLVRMPSAHRQMVARLCTAIGARAAIVHYRLAPEHLFPAALEDAMQTYRQLLSDGIPAEDIILMGDSAGGGLALSAALALRDAREPMPAGIVVMSPLADLTYSGESRQKHRWKDPMLPVSRNQGDARYYLGNHDPTDPLASPIFGDYSGLPPILLQVGSDEILLDDSLRVAQQATSAGVRAEVEIVNRAPHVFQMFPQLPESRDAVSSIARFVSTFTSP